MNKVMLLGRIGQEPDLKVSQGGTAILKLSLATDTNVKKQDGSWEKRPEWHKVTCFGKRAEGLAKILEKGSQIAVDGSLRTSKYQKDGVDHYSTEIVADEVYLCGGKGGGAKKDGAKASAAPQPEFGEGFGDGAYDDAETPF